ncbi:MULTISPECIES: antitoxin [unclassified Brevundimonas]|jgi:antitoxin VapB|uniref:antitoxin n=1 Tax=unclassified Brevundimonas TaxID=2622653 RepID=UPI000C4D9A12|nr:MULTISPECIES: AbrB/MazE/SpoVT family DNA-binding domain-containing protein [unclassified Brevundimonas]MAL88758.1 AbrB/MazE/SpoVT family DNA-binding domain-containing protein [Brevundimonas sp.]HAJ03938.1 AbrB/MazE/SpoVT family DNA-binding domain-containing protein [Brevundimonas sp.]HAV50528.1 AbrB/MazE/SpoVT family DNA-binding domain-containing protein [Brevundimonas sp.]|tara:strand:- start:126 stop:362 length:237 start_codon:yes stop_codon:yes gene_type:complete
MGVVSRIFRSGNSDAVRLPKEITFGPGVEVEIERNGDVITMRPRRMTPRQLVEALDRLPKPSSVQKRPPFIAPVRKGL